MEDRVFKIAMSYLDTCIVTGTTSDDMAKVKKLVDMVKGVSKDKDLPKITTSEQFYEAAKSLGISTQQFPKVIISIFSTRDANKLPSGFIGDIGEFLGEKKGIGVLPTSWLQRIFFMEDLDKKVGPAKWEFFIKDNKVLKELKENKGF